MFRTSAPASVTTQSKLAALLRSVMFILELKSPVLQANLLPHSV